MYYLQFYQDKISKSGFYVSCILKLFPPILYTNKLLFSLSHMEQKINSLLYIINMTDKFTFLFHKYNENI